MQCEAFTTRLLSLKIDECKRLWVMDAGKIGLATSPQVCPPKILIFNLETNQLIHRYVIPMNQYHEDSLFINPVSLTIFKTNKQTLSNTWCFHPSFLSKNRLSTSITRRRVEIVQMPMHTSRMSLVSGCLCITWRQIHRGVFKIVFIVTKPTEITSF